MRRFRPESPEERSRRIARARDKISAGASAQTQLDSLEGVFLDVREILVDNLVENSHRLGELDKHTGYELIALYDIRRRLEERIRDGKQAERASAEEMMKQAKPEVVQ